MSLPLLSDYILWVNNWSIDPTSIIAQCQKKAELNELHSWITPTPEYVENHQSEYIQRPLCAAPLGIKDIIMTQGIRTTCGSKMLAEYIPPYSATCFTRLEKAGWLMIWKNAMDEFAMGSSGENCAWWPTYNPHDHTRVAWWSSSWSAASVANGECLWAVGTDTGGSVRLPASFCGIVGYKPTYGHISRYGVQAMSNSLDQVWTFGRSINDARLLYHAMRWFDPLDMHSTPESSYKVASSISKPIKLCMFNEFLWEGVDPQIKEITLKTVERLKQQGIEVDMIDFPRMKYLVATYYIICPAEVSTNLARFDWLRYGLQEDSSLFDSLLEYYTHIRSTWFGEEVKRRLLIWAHVLSSWYQDQYYNKAIALVAHIKQFYLKLFEQYDAIVGPTTPIRPWRCGSHSHDPLSDYLTDIYTIPANLIGAPAVSLPMGYGSVDGVQLPTWLHLMGNLHHDDALFLLAEYIETILSNSSS